MDWILFALWLLLTPIWIMFWSPTASPKMTFGPPALVLVALAFRWLWRRFVILVAGEAEPSPRGKIQNVAAGWRPEAQLVFRPRRNLHSVWGLALPLRGTVRTSLISAAVGACVGAAAMLDRSTSFDPALSTNNTASRSTNQSDAPTSVRTEVLKFPSLSAEPTNQNISAVTSSNSGADSQRAEMPQPSTNRQSSSDQTFCDVSLCERSYRSFRASDCTYQPYEGPRQYCAR